MRIRLIAGDGQPIVDTQLRAAPDDLRLGQVDEWGVNPERTALDAFLGGQTGQFFEGLDELGAAVRVA